MTKNFLSFEEFRQVEGNPAGSQQGTGLGLSISKGLAEKMGGIYQRAEAKTIFHNLLDASATVVVADHEVTVTLNKRAHNPYLVASHLADQPTPMPWFGDKLLKIRFA